jgi:glycosyltransferase involved in cell wall biosynthesis
VSGATVGLNLLWLVPDEVGGSEQSTLATVRGLIDLDPTDLALRLFVLPAFAAAHPDVVTALPTEIAPVSGSSRVRRVLTESTWLARRTRSLDLVHHAGGTVPVRRTTRCVLTLHDIQPLVATATHSALKRAYLARAVPRSVRGARRVAVGSAFVRETLVDHLGAPPEKIVVIPHAVPVRPPATPSATLVRRYGLTGPVVLYAAVTYPHKDHRTLLEAFAQVRAFHPDAILVLPGGAGNAERQVQLQIDGDPHGLGQSVRRLGRISEADLAGLLELATVVAVPARYEGFGLPALEAMAAGVPVVAADATALPEVVGEAGILVAPGDVGRWAEAIERLLADPDERARLGRAGLERAARFTTAANAGAFADLYRQALADR